MFNYLTENDVISNYFIENIREDKYKLEIWENISFVALETSTKQ